MSYIGKQPVPQSLQSRQQFTGDGSTTTFATIGGVELYEDVFLNGVRLSRVDNEYSFDGTTLTITPAPANGDTVSIILRNDHSELIALPITDSAGNNVLSESGGVVTLTADEANVGSNALVVDSSGNVGVNTSSPNSANSITKVLNINVGSGEKSGISLSEQGSNFFDVFFNGSDNSAHIYQGATGGLVFSSASAEAMRIDSAGVVSVNTGYVTLNNNKVGGIQVTIADDAFAEITPPRIGAHFITITEGGDEAYPFSGCYGFVYADFGDSPLLVQVSVGGDVQTSTSGPPTGTTGNDPFLTLFVGGTSGKIYLENRLGFTGVFQITFL